MTNLVLCGKCLHYHRDADRFRIPIVKEECHHPDITWHRRNPIDGSEMNEYADPYSVNRNLDCGLFEEK